MNKVNQFKEKIATLKQSKSFSDIGEYLEQIQGKLLWSKKKTISLFVIGMFLVSAFTFMAATNMTYPVAYKDGYTTGTTDTLTSVANMLQSKGVTLDWKQTTDGQYAITVTSANGQSATLNLAMNLIVTHRNAQGQVISTERGAGTFTNLGKNWTIQQILYGTAIAGFSSGGGTSGIPVSPDTGSNSSEAALYLGDATTAGSSATSLVQPTETQANGLGRAIETSCYYSAGTGGGTIGQFNVTVTKTCTPSGQTTAEWGLYFLPYSANTKNQNSLIAYDSTPGSKNFASGDTEQETWTGTFS